MKQNLRLWNFYCPKQTHIDYQLYPQKARDKRNTYAEDQQTPPAFLRTFFPLSPDICYGLAKAWLTRRYKIVSHRMARGYPGDSGWQNKVRRKSGKDMSAVGKVPPFPRLRPPSLIPHPCPIPAIPVYISVKRPKDGTLPRGCRQTIGKKAHTVGIGMEWGLVGACLGSASELGANSVRTRTALVLLRPNQDQSESKPSAVQAQSELRSHTEEIPSKRRGHRHGSRKDSEESCVCTHAKAPARSGLGLALGMMCFLLLFCFRPVCTNGQTAASITPLQIGDTIPEALWHLPLQVVNHPDGRDTITLDDYRDKELIILDFWATWCGTCLALFPKLQSIKTRFEDDLLLLPITTEPGGTVTAKMASRPEYKWLSTVSSAVNAGKLTEYLPFRTLPHVVIIESNRVLAITYGSSISMDAIENLLKGEPVGFDVKSDISSFNDSLALLENGGRIKSVLLFSSTLIRNSGGIPGSGRLMMDYTDRSMKYSLLNRSLLALYQQAVDPLLRNRIVLAVSDTDRFVYRHVNDSDRRQQWKSRNTYSYELIAPKGLPMAMVRDLLKSDLDRYLGLVSAVEKRKTDCYVIIPNPGRKHQQTDGNAAESGVQSEMSYGDFLFWANFQAPSSRERPIVVDESNLDTATMIRVVDGFSEDIGALRQTLAINGLGLTKAKRRIEFLVIKDNNENN